MLIKLMFKDLEFSLKSFFIGLVIAIITTIAIAFDTDSNAIFSFYISLMCIFTGYVGRACYNDEKDGVFMFLKSLPVNKDYLVLSKYLSSIIVIVLTIGITYLCNIILDIFVYTTQTVDINSQLFIISVYMIYFSIYLYIFFKNDYSSAQNTAVFVFVFIVVVKKFYNYISEISKYHLSIINLSHVMLIVSCLSIFISYSLSKESFKYKN